LHRQKGAAAAWRPRNDSTASRRERRSVVNESLVAPLCSQPLALPCCGVLSHCNKRSCSASHVTCLPARWPPVFSRCFAQRHSSGLKHNANTTGCSSLLAHLLETLSRGSSNNPCNQSANTRPSAACIAANLQIPFFERFLFGDTRPSNCISARADKALTQAGVALLQEAG
jgi:hypothetical protein